MSEKISWRQAQFAHAKKRADERYGLIYDKKLCALLVKRIQTKTDSHFIYRESSRVSIWLVKHQDRWYPVCYDSEKQNIITFLPPHFVKSPEVWEFARRTKKLVLLYQGQILIR